MAWETYWGELLSDSDAIQTVIYGFENLSEPRPEPFHIPARGALFGFVSEGQARVSDLSAEWTVAAGEWFHFPNGAAIKLDQSVFTRVFCAQNIGFLGLRSMGGPIEDRGRLRYIDTCSDTLLCGPPLRGDPCLNHLHFPAGVDQTEHTHPSTRAGVVARGGGMCLTPSREFQLRPGMIFYIPTGGVHRFQTIDQDMDVIAYHPDSDFGPTHEEHPMVNRTLVGGAKIDNTRGLHIDALIVHGRSIGGDNSEVE